MGNNRCATLLFPCFVLVFIPYSHAKFVLNTTQAGDDHTNGDNSWAGLWDSHDGDPTLYYKIKHSYYLNVCTIDLSETSDFWRTCWNPVSAIDHMKVTSKEFILKSANVPNVRDLCKTNVSRTIQEFPNVPLVNMDFVLGVMKSCNISITSGEEGMSMAEDTATSVVPETENAPHWPSCNHGWSCRRKKTPSRNTDPAIFFIIGIVPVLVFAYSILYKYRHHRALAIIRRIMGVQGPSDNPNTWTETKNTDFSAEAVSAVFVSISMPDGKTLLGTADLSSILEYAYVDEDTCIAT